MIDPQKVKAMSRNAKFEHNRGREALKIKKYCEDMPVWKGLIRSALAGVLLYLVLLLAALLFRPEWFQWLFEYFGELWACIIIAGSMALCVAGYSIISDAIFRAKYKKIRSTLCGYKVDTNFLKKNA